VEAYDPDVAAQIVEVNVPAAEEGSIAAFGYAGMPPLDHANRSKITLFINGQPVQDAKPAGCRQGLTHHADDWPLQCSALLMRIYRPCALDRPTCC